MNGAARFGDTTARKADAGKPPFDLIPPAALRSIAHVLGHGAAKYGAHNWRSDGGMHYTRLIASAYRHLVAIHEGEDIDPESNMPHAAHLACNAIMLLDYTQSGGDLGIDDRHHDHTL